MQDVQMINIKEILTPNLYDKFLNTMDKALSNFYNFNGKGKSIIDKICGEVSIIRTNSNVENLKGAFDKDNNIIYIDNRELNISRISQTLMHEFIHAIQYALGETFENYIEYASSISDYESQSIEMEANIISELYYYLFNDITTILLQK